MKFHISYLSYLTSFDPLSGDARPAVPTNQSSATDIVTVLRVWRLGGGKYPIIRRTVHLFTIELDKFCHCLLFSKRKSGDASIANLMSCPID